MYVRMHACMYVCVFVCMCVNIGRVRIVEIVLKFDLTLCIYTHIHIYIEMNEMSQHPRNMYVRVCMYVCRCLCRGRGVFVCACFARVYVCA